MANISSKILKTKDKNFKKKLNVLLNRGQNHKEDLYKIVFDIIEEVRSNGDLSLKKFVQNFDKIKLNEIRELFVSKSVLKEAYLNLKKEEKNALNLAAQRIKEFHEYQIPKNIGYNDGIDIKLGLNYSPIEAAGFYVPGGKAIYPSSVLMNAIPAFVAGVKRRVVPVSTGSW